MRDGIELPAYLDEPISGELSTSGPSGYGWPGLPDMLAGTLELVAELAEGLGSPAERVTASAVST